MYSSLCLVFLHDGVEIGDDIPNHVGIERSSRRPHASGNQFMHCLVRAVLRLLAEVWELQDDAKHVFVVWHALFEADRLDYMFCGLARFGDDFCDLLSNLGVDNVVVNQVEDMEDVFNLRLFVFHRVPHLGRYIVV